MPFPGTEFYDWAKKNNHITVDSWDKWLDSNGQLDCIVSYVGLSDTSICELKDKLMVRYYTSPKQLTRMVARNMKPSEMKRMGKAGVDYLKYLRRDK